MALSRIFDLYYINCRGAWLAQSVEHATFDLGVKFEPRGGCRDYLKKIKTITKLIEKENLWVPEAESGERGDWRKVF